MPSKKEVSDSDPDSYAEQEEEEEEDMEEQEEEEEVEVEEEEEEEEEVEEVEEEVEEEEEEEEEEEPEEEEDEEPEEEEEEEEEGENVNADSTSGSPVAANHNNDDSSQEVESEGQDEDLKLEKSEGSLFVDAHNTSDGQFDSDNTLKMPVGSQVKEMDHVGDGDSKPQIMEAVFVSSEDNKRSQECLSEEKVDEAQQQNGVEIKACIDAQLVDNEAPSNQSNPDHVISVGDKKTKSSCTDEEEVATETPMGDVSASRISVSNFTEETEKVGDIKSKASSSLTPQIRPRSLSPAAEREERNKRPALICDFYARGWCIKGTACKFLHQKDGLTYTEKSAKQDGPSAGSEDKLDKEGLRTEKKKSFLSSEPLGLLDVNEPSSKSSLSSERTHMGKFEESLRPHPYLDRHEMHASPRAHVDLKHSEEFIRGYSSSMYGNNINSFSHDKRVVEPSSLNLEGRSMPYGSHTSAGFYSSLNSSYNASLPSKGVSPLHQTFPWSGATASERSSLDGDQGYYSSKSSFLHRHSSSPFYSRPVAHPTVNNWEPSIPFRPSFNFSSFISSPKSQYDPFLDSIDPPNGGDRAFQEYPFSQRVTMPDIPNPWANSDNASFPQQPQYGALDQNMSTHSIPAATTPAGATETFVAEKQNRSSLVKEARSSKSARIIKALNANVMEVDLDRSLQADGSKHKESKMLKHFRASLVEFVKDLVKPHWRDGHLSKDAHNAVVKKAVEKVLSTLQPHQVPNNAESTDQYLSASRPKLTKLVEGYVGKFTKS